MRSRRTSRAVTAAAIAVGLFTVFATSSSGDGDCIALPCGEIEWRGRLDRAYVPGHTFEGDVTLDGVVDVDDLLRILAGFGDPYDIDDVLTVLAVFGCDGVPAFDSGWVIPQDGWVSIRLRPVQDGVPYGELFPEPMFIPVGDAP